MSNHYVIVKHHAPPSDIDKCFAEFTEQGSFDENYDLREEARKGVDGWGRRLILELCESGNIRWRSMGPDGVDNFGGGDDIEAVTNVKSPTVQFLDRPKTD